jgi:hypothetical protein
LKGGEDQDAVLGVLDVFLRHLAGGAHQSFGLPDGLHLKLEGGYGLKKRQHAMQTLFLSTSCTTKGGGRFRGGR